MKRSPTLSFYTNYLCSGISRILSSFLPSACSSNQANDLEKKRKSVPSLEVPIPKRRPTKLIQDITDASIVKQCTAMENGSPTSDLIGCQIKVWWPLDKMFYTGIVQSFDDEKRKHVILYTDGDVEVLDLDKERWEFSDNGEKSKSVRHLQRSGSSKNIRPKVGSSVKKRWKSIGGSGKDKELEVKSPSSKVGEKRISRKSSEQKQSGLPKSKSTMERSGSLSEKEQSEKAEKSASPAAQKSHDEVISSPENMEITHKKRAANK